MCGGDNSDINLLFLGTAYAFKHAVLKDSEQAGLARRRQFADLVKKKHSPVRTFKNSLAGMNCSRKTSFFMPEQFAVDQRIGNSSAVDLDERSVHAGRGPIQRFRHNFLARAAFSEKQDRALLTGYLPDHVRDLFHSRQLRH